MAFPILPLSTIDGLHDLNRSLDAYQQLVLTYVAGLSRNGPPSDSEAFAAGLSALFQPIMDGYLDIHSQSKSFEALGLKFGDLLPEAKQP